MKKLVKLFSTKIFVLLSFFSFSAFMSAAQPLSKGAELGLEHALYSDNSMYGLVIKGNGNLILFLRSNIQILWESKTAHKGVRKLYFGERGNLVLLDSIGQIVWNNDAYVKNARMLRLIDDGGLGIFDEDPYYPLWSLRKPGEGEYNLEKGYILPEVEPLIRGKMSKGESINKSEELKADEYLISPNKVHKLIMTHTGAFILYNGDKETWNSGTGLPASLSGPRKLTFGQEGNLTLVDQYGYKSWDSESKHYAAGILKIQNDGNVVIYSTNGTIPIWSMKDPNGVGVSNKGYIIR
jgi:hypothetical protein